jgi:hypothetical protein
MKLHIGYLLDRSGSMANIWRPTIDGLNQYKNEQVEQGDETWLTLWAFDSHGAGLRRQPVGSCRCAGHWNQLVNPWQWNHALGCHHTHVHVEGKPLSAADVEKVYDAWNVKDIPNLSYDRVTPRGGTPLLDAIQDLVTAMERWEYDNREWFGTDGKILIAIQTDGYENASRKRTKDQIRDLITRKTGEGWEFAFMGAGIDAVTEGTSLGIHNNMRYDADFEGTREAYASFSASTNVLRGTGTYNWVEPESNK